MNFRFTARPICPALLISLSLSGCSWLTIGEEHFACSGMPGDPKCMSASAMYDYSLNHPPETATAVSASLSGEYVFSADEYASLNADKDSKGYTVIDSRGVPRKLSVINNRTGKKEELEIEGKVLVGDDEITQNFVTPRLPYAPVPVRTPAMVMRIWVAPYEDLNGDLNAPGYVYTEIEPRRWVTQAARSERNSHFTPLVKPFGSSKGTEAVKSVNTSGKSAEKNNLEILKEKNRAKLK